MPYGKRYKKGRRSRRRASRKPTIKAVKKIAKAVAKTVLEKQVEHFADAENFASPFVDTEPEIYGNPVTCRGMFDQDPTDMNDPTSDPLLTSQNVLNWGPRTHFIKTISNANGDFANQQDGERAGRSIYLTGIQVRALLILPKDAYKADYYCYLYKTKNDVDNFYNIYDVAGEPNDVFTMKKDLPSRGEYTLVNKKKFTLVQRTGYHESHAHIVVRKDFFFPIGKKITYVETVSNSADCVKTDLVNGHYQLYWQSDAQHWTEADAPNRDQLKSYPQVTGQYRWCYNDM